jgi:hypothetical protein
VNRDCSTRLSPTLQTGEGAFPEPPFGEHLVSQTFQSHSASTGMERCKVTLRTTQMEIWGALGAFDTDCGAHVVLGEGC